MPPSEAVRARLMTGRDFGATGAAPARTARPPVQTGLDVLRAQAFAPLKGKRVGLVTNHTGRARDGATAIDLLFASKDLKLVALFSPEHGIRGTLDATVPSEVDEKTKLPINSLYGDTRRPTAAMLEGLDAIVIDLQDIGSRFWTYMTTTAYVMEEAAKRKLPVFVLDRPNPVNGWQIEGPALDKEATGFVGYFPAMPIRHGMTLGELAKLFNGENKIGADLTVVAMKNWRRDDWFDETALPWVSPSPNMRNMNEAALYTGIGAIEGTNLSVGRGTDTPFEHVGAPWIDGVQLADALNARAIPGVRFYPVRFTPASSKYANEECQGVFIIVTDRAALRPVRVGVEIASALIRMYPAQYQLDLARTLLGSREALGRIRAGDDPAAISASFEAPLACSALEVSAVLVHGLTALHEGHKDTKTQINAVASSFLVTASSSAAWTSGMMSSVSAGTSTQPMLSATPGGRLASCGDAANASCRSTARRIASCSPQEISTRNSSPPQRNT